MKKYLIVGLGNIGDEYVNTRHNIGFDMLDFLVNKLDFNFSNASFGSVCKYKYKGRSFIFLKPNTYMNLSGAAVQYWLKFEKIEISNLLIRKSNISKPILCLVLTYSSPIFPKPTIKYFFIY